MNSIDRIYAAIEHRPVDKVPKGELGVAAELTKKLLGVENVGWEEEIQVRKMLNMDMFNWWCAGTPETFIRNDEQGNKIMLDSWGNLWQRSHATADIIEPAIKDEDQILSLKFPDTNIYRQNTEIISYFSKNSPFFVFGQTEGIFTPISWLCGFENFMIYSCTNKEELQTLAMRLAEHYAELAKMLIDAGAHGILIGDDIAFNTGTFFSPQTMRELIFPALKREVELIKAYKDVPVFMHTDGDLNKVMEDIIDCGFDGLQSLQPSANMNLSEIKQKYGDRLCLMGNIDINEILPFGTEEMVRKTVKETIDTGIKGSGFILSTCNILTRDIPAANAIAMYDEAEKYQMSF
jgi:uroporphyrinogen decarboxylase